MNAIESLRHSLLFSHRWVEQLADDLVDSPLTPATTAGGNHPLWIMGHLVVANSGLTSMISGRANPFSHWDRLFEGGTWPVADGSGCPSYSEVMQAWKTAHAETLNLLSEFDDARLDETPIAVWEPLRTDPEFATNGRLFLFIAMHEMSHRGQLADVRRVLGRKPFV
ncbi:MAG TPA: DinB family protein [Pirellulaceae bacterium]|nr:DinB family protein [Pirellulaceae bacterium]HMO91827.1 DinB family protein [Pirellulaceae bacterium]HMP69890.1 DinB family protein [Pirellulaceae bacterium]